ncbi:hypothetical protein O6H91_01G091700 [Diphasiastrum complanatum]|uniref:Uncharacterized protein n=1 Tax=Diphasiastrum complanatum TaxID=34168 RepID=A0ACC2ET44_DIPCM|nr:hypothetical protein O6H91_01G091700 [Diphasiastrum complanatum]
MLAVTFLPQGGRASGISKVFYIVVARWFYVFLLAQPWLEWKAPIFGSVIASPLHVRVYIYVTATGQHFIRVADNGIVCQQWSKDPIKSTGIMVVF